MTLIAPYCIECGQHGCICSFKRMEEERLAQHPDDLAIDDFVVALKAKMAAGRAKGRSGWDDPHQCTNEDLSIGLRMHVGKGDPLDVALYCMMLWARQSPIVGVVRANGMPPAPPELLAELDRQMKDLRDRESKRPVEGAFVGRRKSD